MFSSAWERTSQSPSLLNEIPALKSRSRRRRTDSLMRGPFRISRTLSRNFTQFTLLTPGVQHSTFNINGPENPQGTTSVTTNGSSYWSSGMAASDGTDNREPVLGIIVINPTLDSVGEMKVTSSNYDAEFGGAIRRKCQRTDESPAEISSMAMPSSIATAGNSWHAIRSLSPLPIPYDRKTYFRARYSGQFGGSLSGPIIKDRTFFFMDYPGARGSACWSEPTACLYRLNRHVTPASIRAREGTCRSEPRYLGSQPVYYHPAGTGVAGQQYASNAIPRSVISPQAINL